MKKHIPTIILWFLVVLAVVCQIQNATHHEADIDSVPSAQSEEPLK